MKPWRWLVRGLPASLLAASPAGAQVGEELIVQPQIRQGYDRGRNFSVDETPRPDYAALGTRFGGMIVYPRLETGTGATTNTYLVDSDPVASPFVYVRPSGRIVSDWARHELRVTGTATLRDYVGESRRNERVWNVGAEGRLDIRRAITVEADVNSSRTFENVFSGEVTPTIAALSQVRQDFASLQGTYTSGRGRAFVVTDYSEARFSPVRLLAGGTRDQSDRDRSIARLTGQLEYARSPSISLFGQLSGSRTRYDRDLLTGGPNLSSDAARLLVGANFDIAGRVRGTFGIGYSIRDFNAASYDAIRGLSVESRIQTFPLRRLTLTAVGERSIEDAAVERNRRPFWNTRLSLRADYEVLRNLIVNATGSYSRQRYLDTRLRGGIYGAGIGGRYLASRRVNLLGSLSYSGRSSNDTQLLGGVNEGRVELAIAYQL